MSKIVVLKLVAGSWEQGFKVILQIGEDGAPFTTEISGFLPPAPEICQTYKRWQLAHSSLSSPMRIKAKANQVKNVSIVEPAAALKDSLQSWLNNSDSFRPLRDTLLRKLQPSDTIRMLLQAEDSQLWLLPWQLWEDFFQEYTQAELAVGALVYDAPIPIPTPAKAKVRILAILGDSTGIEVEADRQLLLEKLPDAEIVFLVEPERQQLDNYLWDEKGWDILFFAGHSHTQGEAGHIDINPQESVTIDQLRNALTTAINRGLKLAIFNSCDGLGLARQLANLQIPQVIFMREPVPDVVAQAFLKNFLVAFGGGKPLYLAVREARDRLQALEAQFPCATWLPIIYQNLAQAPPTWQSFKGQVSVPNTSFLPRKFSIQRVLLTSLVVAAGVMGIRYLGLLQSWEFKAFDHMLQLRSIIQPETPDNRILVVKIDNQDYDVERDKQKQEALQGRSLSYSSLAKLLEILERHQPRVIGLDLYRNSQPEQVPRNVLSRYQQMSQLIGVCKVRNGESDTTGIAPPSGIPNERLGFSDFDIDPDGVLRRQILFMGHEPESPCQADYAFSSQIAFHYLYAQGIKPEFTPQNKYLQLNKTIFKPLNDAPGAYRRVEGGNQILINYRSRHVPSVALSDILMGQFPASAIKDKIILIGVTHDKTEDKWMKPHSPSNIPETDGVFVQAQMISNILSAVLDGRPLLWMWSWWGEVVWIVGWSLIGGLVVWRLSNSKSNYLSPVLLISSTSLSLYTVCFIFLLQGCLVPLIPSLAAMILSGGVVFGNHKYLIP